MVSLWRNNKEKNLSIHRMLAIAFIPRVKGKNIINHINGIKTDNRLENLEWTDHSGNLIHAYENGLNNKRKKTKVVDLKSNVEYILVSMKEASLFMNEDKRYVSGHNKRWGTYRNEKYRWEMV